MPPRLVACDPCRFSKLACDHARPVCSRCAERNETCTYRSRPFKRRKTSHDQRSVNTSAVDISFPTPPSISRNHLYPNPGYLGLSSHEAIFGRLSTGSHVESNNPASEPAVESAQVQHGAKLIEQMRSVLNISLCKDLTQYWTSKGVNLALAGGFVEQCTQTALDVLASEPPSVQEKPTNLSWKLFAGTCRPLNANENPTIEDFRANAWKDHWEALGLFFTALSRATMDVISFEPLYDTEKDRRGLRRLAMHFSDCCLEIALSLDCLNDVQLVLQYENFILHSYADGDQSYNSWRRLGDVMSSLIALGYHEQIGNRSTTPEFLIDLRRAAFARSYSADKNVSIFLGRPPRLLRKYCKLQLSRGVAGNTPVDGISGSHLADFEDWSQTEQFDYAIDTRWSFECSMFKEEIMDLLRDGSQDERTQSAHLIQADAEAHWQALPSHFRLRGPLKLCERKPTECDFMVSARLNHLHILLLLRLAVLRQTPEPDSQLLDVSNSMLSLVVEALLLKGRLANSGTSLIWKVAYYGLPAAGIICLSLLNRTFMTTNGDVSMADVVQSLNVLVAEVETGTFIHFEHPNYALLARAAQTIKNVLDRVLRGELSNNAVTKEAVSQTLPNGPEEWMPWDFQDSWDFEIDFWRNLAEHPILAGVEPTIDGLL